MLRKSIQALWVLVGLLIAPAVFAERPLVAVLDFQEIASGLAPHEVELLADVARGESLDRLGTGYNIITRENLLDLLKAHGTNLEQCQGACETETGRLIGADYVVSGSIVKAFGAFKVNLKLHRTSPPELLGAEVRTAESLASLEAEVRRATGAVLVALSGERASPSPTKVVIPKESGRPTRSSGGGLAEATNAVLGALSPSRGLGALLGGAEARPDDEREEEERESSPPSPEVEGGLHLTVDVGGMLFFGPSAIVEIGGKSRFAAWYRAVNVGLLATSDAFIDTDNETYEYAYTVGIGGRWYGRGHDGMDGLWYGLGAEYYTQDVLNSSEASYGGHYIVRAVIASGLVCYRWGSESWANQVGAGIGMGFELEFSQPSGGEASFQRIYPALVYEIEFF